MIMVAAAFVVAALTVDLTVFLYVSAVDWFFGRHGLDATICWDAPARATRPPLGPRGSSFEAFSDRDTLERPPIHRPPQNQRHQGIDLRHALGACCVGIGKFDNYSKKKPQHGDWHDLESHTTGTAWFRCTVDAMCARF
ncbi:hypothetical protein FS749_005319 [Ceratobasidium sp. UAMH 11750]|nr:hypothetical protein FS749_005319 [Ceratobasidium sp. UAMH 11750]